MGRRHVVIGLSVISVLLVLAVLAAVVFSVAAVRRAYPEYDGSVSLPRLAGDVEVLRDEHGIPQIYADTAEDLFRAQGYVHAQDRFWEMDLRRHITSGRLAELFGEEQLATDAFMRTMDWRGVAERELPQLAPDTRRYLHAYADGVNSWLDQDSGGELGVAYTLLDLTGAPSAPEPWTPVDSLAWLKAMAWDLGGNMSDEIDRALLYDRLTPEQVEALYPDDPIGRHGTILSEDEFSHTGSIGLVDDADQPLPPRVVEQTRAGARQALRSTAAQIEALPPMVGSGPGIGSNSWVVDGSHTTTGAPMLANDPHLSASMPSIWYQVGLHCRETGPECPFDVTGFSFSGLPGVVIGHNEQIAWGFTNLNPDVTDLYLEYIEDGQVRTPDGSEPVSTREEVIEVNGADPVTITVRSTRHGPIVSDRDDQIAAAGRAAATQHDPVPPADPDEPGADGDAGGEIGVALRWTALEPTRTADAIFALNAATNWEQFRSAASLFEVPAQNLVYADVEGNIGYQAPGTVPVRRDSDGRTPTPGWTDVGDWVGYIPFEDMPRVLNPDDGMIVAANQAVVGDEYPYLLTDDWDYGHRAARITELLTQRAPLAVSDMDAIQNDTKHPAADSLLPILQDMPVFPGYYGDGQRLLHDWDGRQEPGSAAAAYFNAVWAELLERTFVDELGEDLAPAGSSRWVEVVARLLENPQHQFWDDVDTPEPENRTEILNDSLRAARDELTRQQGKDPAGWSWGSLHELTLTEQSFGGSDIGIVEWLYNHEPVPVGGGSATVLATGWDPSTGFETISVPSMRMVVDLSDLDASRWVDLTGISGHPRHEHYGDQVARWANGQTLPMRWSDEVVERATEHRLVLTPSDPERTPGSPS
ncbi:MAG TPA: penicillin acylase family protein [Jiangellaceae bacterium]|nr:penicillin acylase family protein [Jiangellaceae bacterium]